MFVSASEEPVQRLLEAGLVSGTAVTVARTSVVLAVPAGNPGGVSGLSDLARDDLVIALCAVEVPCGAAAARLLDAEGVSADPDTYARDARALLTALRLGEVDAGLVYRSDVLSADGAVELVPVQSAAPVVVQYPAVVLADAPNPDGARAVVDLLTSPQGRTVLLDAGFELP